MIHSWSRSINYFSVIRTLHVTLSIGKYVNKNCVPFATKIFAISPLTDVVSFHCRKTFVMHYGPVYWHRSTLLKRPLYCFCRYIVIVWLFIHCSTYYSNAQVRSVPRSATTGTPILRESFASTTAISSKSKYCIFMLNFIPNATV